MKKIINPSKGQNLIKDLNISNSWLLNCLYIYEQKPMELHDSYRSSAKEIIVLSAHCQSIKERKIIIIIFFTTLD